MFIIDVQGFPPYKECEFICKEICIVNTCNGEVYHTLVKFPHQIKWFNGDIQRRIDWLTDNIHGLKWDQDAFTYIPYENITNYIKNIINDNDVFVKGFDKKHWLNKLISNNVEEFMFIGCPNLKKLKTINRHCNFHCMEHFYNVKNCAKENALLLYNWYINNTF